MPDLEIVVDKIRRAAWPPDAVADGPFESLFAPSVTARLVRGKGDLMEAGNPWRSRALIDRMAACERCREPSWHVHLFVVDRVAHGPLQPAGMMLESADPGPRRGAVVAWDAVARFAVGHDAATAARLYFRLVAHEVGHLLRLGHEETASLMTPLAWFRGRKGYPANVATELSAAHRRWLQTIAVDQLCPGRA